MADYSLTPAAGDDLSEILDFIAADSTEAALRVHDHFVEVFQLLAASPRAGHRRGDLTSRPVRFLPVYSYLVVYLADVEPLQVVRVLSGARDIERILE